MYGLNPLQPGSKADVIPPGSVYTLNVGAFPKSASKNPFSLPKNLLHNSGYSTHINESGQYINDNHKFRRNCGLDARWQVTVGMDWTDAIYYTFYQQTYGEFNYI